MATKKEHLRELQESRDKCGSQYNETERSVRAQVILLCTVLLTATGISAIGLDNLNEVTWRVKACLIFSSASIFMTVMLSLYLYWRDLDLFRTTAEYEENRIVSFLNNEPDPYHTSDPPSSQYYKVEMLLLLVFLGLSFTSYAFFVIGLLFDFSM